MVSICAIAQAWIPITASPFGCIVKNRPKRHQVRRTTRVLVRIGRGGTHLTTPEMANAAIASGEDIESWNVCIFSAHIVAGEVAVNIRVKPKVLPAAFLLDRQQALDG